MPNRTTTPTTPLDRVNPPQFYNIKPFKLIDPQHLEFDNDLKAFLFHAGEQELVRIEWIFQNNYLSENSLIPSCVPAMVMEGTEKRSNKEIADLVDFHGAYLVPEFKIDTSALTLFTLTKHLPALLPVILDLLTNAVFPERELKTYLRNRRQRLEVSLQKNDVIAHRLFNRTLFGDTRYGIAPELEDFDHVTSDQLGNWYSRIFQPANCTMIVSGNCTPEVIDLINDHFGSNWNNTARLEPAAPPTDFPVVSGQLHVEPRADALQSAIRLGFRTIQRIHSDFPGLQFVNTALGGYFGSRLMANIREDKGYTYGIGSGIASFKHDAYLTIATEVGVDVTRSALQEIEREIQLIKEHPLPLEEMELVRNYLLGKLLGSLENVFSHADHFKQVYFSDMDLSYYEYYQQTILNMDAATVQQLANDYLDYDKMEKIVVGKL